MAIDIRARSTGISSAESAGRIGPPKFAEISEIFKNIQNVPRQKKKYFRKKNRNFFFLFGIWTYISGGWVGDDCTL